MSIGFWLSTASFAASFPVCEASRLFIFTAPLWDDPAEVSVLNIPSINALEDVSDELSPFVFQNKKIIQIC